MIEGGGLDRRRPALASFTQAVAAAPGAEDIAAVCKYVCAGTAQALGRIRIRIVSR